jgi:hypothetical protein
MNKIASLKTQEINGSKGISTAIMLGIDVEDKSQLPEFISQLAETFTSQMMIGPANTDHMLVTITGECTSSEFKMHWTLLCQTDPVLKIYMSQMEVADIIHGTKEGQKLDQTSLK